MALYCEKILTKDDTVLKQRLNHAGNLMNSQYFINIISKLPHLKLYVYKKHGYLKMTAHFHLPNQSFTFEKTFGCHSRLVIYIHESLIKIQCFVQAVSFNATSWESIIYVKLLDNYYTSINITNMYNRPYEYDTVSNFELFNTEFSRILTNTVQPKYSYLFRDFNMDLLKSIF